MNNTTRISYIDTAKAIAIILMVAAHSLPPDIVIRFIAIFHMPLFFFFSGYFLKIPESTKDVSKLIKKRFKGLYIPYIKYSLAFLALHNLFFHLNLYHSDYVYYGVDEHIYEWKDFVRHLFFIVFTMDYHEQLLGGFWFLKTLLLSSILSATLLFVIQLLTKKNTMRIVYVLAAVFWIMTIVLRHQGTTLPVFGSIYIITLGGLYYLLGYVYRYKESLISKILTKQMLVFLSFCLLAVAVFYHSLAMTSLHDYDILFSPVLAVTGIIITAQLSRWIEKTKCSALFHYIGENTMIILALHLISFKIVSLLKVQISGMTIDHLAEFPVITTNNDLFWIVYTLVGLLIPLTAHKIKTRIIK